MPRKGVIPPQFLKHPPRSWKGDMPRVRRESRSDRRKSYRGSKRSDPRMRTRRKGNKVKVHVIPAALAALAVAEPLINSQGTGYSALSSIPAMVLGPNRSGAAEDFVYNLENNVSTAIKPAIVLGVLAYATKEVGKMFRLNKIGTKEVRLA